MRLRIVARELLWNDHLQGIWIFFCTCICVPISIYPHGPFCAGNHCGDHGGEISASLYVSDRIEIGVCYHGASPLCLVWIPLSHQVEAQSLPFESLLSVLSRSFFLLLALLQIQWKRSCCLHSCLLWLHFGSPTFSPCSNNKWKRMRIFLCLWVSVYHEYEHATAADQEILEINRVQSR